MGTLILVVEDDPDAQAIYGACLRHAGFDVIVAGTAREAVEAAQTNSPEVVVLDRRLPDRDGLEVARQWRAGAGRMSKVPIIALTAYTTRPDVEAALVAGCDAFLAKPCPGNVLVAHVAKLLFANEPTRKMKKFDPDDLPESQRDLADPDSGERLTTSGETGAVTARR